MTIQAITFDLDDTLWPVAPVIAHAEQIMHRWLAEHCPAVTRHYDLAGMRAVRERIGREHPNLAHDFSTLRRRSLEHALHEHGYDGEHVDGAFTAFYRARQNVTPYEGVIDAVRKLSGRFRLASVSNGNADLTVIGLDELFPVRVHARQLGHAKPAPEIFHHACRALALEPEQVLHVGDDPVMDVDGARGAGLSAVWINQHGTRWPLDTPHPDTLRSVTELHRLLD